MPRKKKDAAMPAIEVLGFAEGDEGFDPYAGVSQDDGTTRPAWAVANDWVIEGANAAVGGVKTIVDFVAPGSAPSRALGGFIERGESMQSDVTKAAKEKFRTELEEAGGFTEEAMAAGRYIWENPGLAAAYVAGNFAPVFGAVKGASGVAHGVSAARGAKQGLSAAQIAANSAQAGTRAGVAAGSAMGASMSGGDAAGQVYDELTNPQRRGAVLASPEAQALIAQGMSEDEAIHEVATTAARKASVAPAAIGGVFGAFGLERALAGGAGRGRAVTGLIEGLQGATEETATGVSAGMAGQAIDSSIDPMKGAGANAALGFVYEGVPGVILGGRREDETPAGPLTRAADTALGVQAGAEAAATRLLPAPPAQSAEWEVVDDRPRLPGGAARLALGFEPEAVEPTIMVDSRGNAARAPDEWVRQAEAQRAADAEMGLTPDVRAAQARRSQGEADGTGEDLGGAAAGVPAAGDLAPRDGGAGEAVRVPEPGRVGVAAPGVEGSDAAGGVAVRGQPEPDGALNGEAAGGNVTTPEAGDESIDARIDAAGRDWWAGMDPAARTDALKAAGVTDYSEKSPWARISKRNRARLNGVRLQAEGLARAESQQAGITQAPKRTREQASAERKRVYREANPFRSFLAEHGVSVDDRSDTGGERNRPVMVPFHGPLYRRNGLRLDELARRAVEAGFLTQADVDSDLDNGGVNKLSDMIRRELAGERILPVTVAESEQEAQWRAEMDARYEAMQEAEEAIAALTDDEINALLQLASDEDAELRNEEIDVALEPGEAQEGGASTEETAPGTQASGDSRGGAEARDESPGEVARPAFDLDRQSADDVRRQEEQRRKDEARAEREAQEQARRDAAPPAEDFTLAGSNRPADEAAARGQQELSPRSEAKDMAADLDRVFRAEGFTPSAVQGTLSRDFGSTSVSVRIVGAGSPTKSVQLSRVFRVEHQPNRPRISAPPSETETYPSVDAALVAYREWLARRAPDAPARGQQELTETPSAPVQAAPGFQWKPLGPDEKAGDRWQGSMARDFKPNAHQQAIMDAVRAALDAGKFYADEVKDFVADRLGITKEQLALNKTRVQGGDFGYEVYLARKAVEGRQKDDKLQAATAALNLKPGERIGTLVFNNDFKRNTGMKVVSVDGDSVVLEGKRGGRTIQQRTDSLGVLKGIDRAKEKGYRPDSADEFIAGRSKQSTALADEANEVLAEVSLKEASAQKPEGVAQRTETRDGQPVGRDGLTDTERASNRLDGIADDLAMQVQQESSERDFAPSEIPAAIEQWAKDNKVDAGELRTRVVDRLRKRLSEGRMRQVEQALSEKKPAAPVAANRKPGISDFGEKIEGARKDVWASFRDKMQQAGSVDIAAEPLSKSWPAPDYQALLDDGGDPWSVAFMHAARDAIPTKPQKAWKVKEWVASVRLLRDVSMGLIDGRIDRARAQELLAEAEKTSRGMSDIAGRIELYQLVGHSKSLAGVRITRGEYSMHNRIAYNPPKIIWTIEKQAAATAFSNWPRELASGETKEQALANFKEKFDSLEINPSAKKETTFEVYSRRGEKGYWIGKKVGRNPIFLAGPFETIKEARTYKDSHNAELTEKLERSKEVPSERRDTNRPRVGEDMRAGADVTPQMFEEAFGFKGVQFGNYVEQSRRQKDLNDAYDALMDMAALIGVSPKALSLNGELGLAFGARGKGGKGAAAAHYEREHVVINLTKREGAGSLGHEWWHALDNYFSRMRGRASDDMTESSDVGTASRTKDFVHQGAVRREMVAAFGEVLRAIRSTAIKARSSRLDAKRTKAYWTTNAEMSARAFESFLISKLQDQGASNDYLANIVDEATWAAAEKLGFELDGSYPYPTAGEVPAIRAAFEHFFQTVESRETDRGLALFEPTPQYRVDEPQASQPGLFDLLPEQQGDDRRARSDRARVRRNVQPADAVSDTEAPAGEYFLRTVLGTETNRQLGASVIKTHADAARATSYLYRNAVERFDAIVTDAKGKPLAVVGGFKGALSQSAVYPATIIGEAVRVPGAARIWFSHNHPSGTAELSSADQRLHRALNSVFRGSGIEPMGMLAVAGDSYAFEGVSPSGLTGDVQSNLPINGKTENVQVPVIERMIAHSGTTGHQVTSPSAARSIGAIFYGRTKEPGLMLVNSQNRVAAWVPLSSNMLGKLRGTGGLQSLYRAVSESTAGGAIIVHGGELDAQPNIHGVPVVENIGAALAQVDVKPLDAINVVTGESRAERGMGLASGPVYSRNARRGAGMFIPAVEAIVKRVRDGWANGPEVVVVQSIDDPTVPAEVRGAAQSRQADTGDFEAEGFFHDGTVYLVADSLDSEADVVRVLLHEAAGHYGLRGLFGDRLNSILEQIVRSKPKAVADKMREYGLTGAEGRLIAAEEVLARMAEKNPKMGFVRRAIAAIRSWLREIGFDLRLSDSEIIRDIVLPARRYVTYGAPRNPGRGSWLGASLNQSGADKLISDHSSADAEMLSDLASSESFLEKGFRGIDVPRQRVVLGAVRRVIKQLQIADAVIELIPVDVMDMLRGEQGAANMALHDEAMLENLLSVEGNKPITIPVDGATALVRATALAAAERMRVDQLRRDFVAVGAAEGALDRDASRSRGGATASAATADIRPFGLGRPGRVEVEGRPALGTLEGRHDVTPESDVVLGADGGDTPSAPPIISVPARQWVESGTAANVAGVPLFSRRATQKKLSDSIADLFASSKGFNWWHRTIGTQYEKAQRNAHFKRVFDTAQEFLNDVSDFGNRAADAAPSLLPKLDGIRDAFKKPPTKRDLGAIARPIFDGTLMDANPHKGRVWTDAELREKYGLNDRQIGLYREFRAAVDKSLDDMGKTDLLRYAGKDASGVRDRVLAAPSVGEAARILSAHLSAAAQANPKRADALNDTAATVREKAQSIEGLKRGGYAPLMRFGRFSVYVTREGKGEPEQMYFGMFETQREANVAARRLRAEFPDATVQQGVMSQEAFKLFQGVNPDTLEIFADVAGIEKTEAFQQYLKLARANRSAMKRLIHRKGTVGFSEDVTRVLASFITSNARAGSMNLHTGELNEAVAAIPKEQGDVRDEGVKLAEFARGTNDPSSKLRGLLFMQFLGGSVASAVVNMTQPITMTYPYLARFVGAGRAGTMLTKAMRDAVTGVGSDADLAAALKRAEREGIVSPQEIHHLYAEGGVGLSRNPLVRRATLVWGSFFSAAEQFNRRASFIAAYRIARAQKEANPYAFATHAVEETQGIYSRANRPNWSRNPVGATVLTFKQFSIHYVEFLKRLPPAQQALALVVLALAAGLEELPFADDVDDAVDTIAHALGYNWSSKRAKREWLAKTIGADASEFVLKGAQAIPGFPLGISARLGLGNLVPGTGMLLGSTRDRSREITEVVGVAGSFAQTAIDAAGKALAGDAAGAAQEVMPLAVKNVLKGLDMYQTGMYRDSRGRRVMDVGGYESLVKAIGFQPAGVSAAQERAGIAQQQAAHVRNVQQQFSERMALARFERDADALRSAREDLREWNRKNPEARIQVSEASINRRLRAMRATRAERIEKAAPRAIRAALDL